MVADAGLAVVREVKQKPQELGRAVRAFKSGAWYEIGIRLTGGLIQVEVDKQQVVNVTDPAPLAPGFLAFGSLSGTGFAYDDVSLSLSSRDRAGLSRPSSFLARSLPSRCRLPLWRCLRCRLSPPWARSASRGWTLSFPA